MKQLLIINVLGTVTQVLNEFNDALTAGALCLQTVISVYIVIKDARKK